MDTKTLAVGQRVWMQSGSLLKEATVIEVTEECIAAKPICFEQNERPWMIHFQKDGKQFTFEGLAARIGSKNIDCGKYLGNLGVYEWYWGGWARFNPHPLCGDGQNPWELVEAHEATPPSSLITTET